MAADDPRSRRAPEKTAAHLRGIKAFLCLPRALSPVPGQDHSCRLGGVPVHLPGHERDAAELGHSRHPHDGVGMAVGCWCCGQECMWCEPENPADCGELHCCAECKIAGCEWCGGCSECTKLHRGGWSSEGIQIRNDGAR